MGALISSGSVGLVVSGMKPGLVEVSCIYLVSRIYQVHFYF